MRNKTSACEARSTDRGSAKALMQETKALATFTDSTASSSLFYAACFE
jgi:hypothetical protein